jgi:hypothetical protein
MTQTATDRAIEINTQTATRAAAAGWVLWSTVPTEAAYWAEFGIHTGAELDTYFAFADYVDTYKEVHGIKPRWMMREMYDAAKWGALTADLHAAVAAEAQREADEVAAEAVRVAEITSCRPLTGNLGDAFINARR